MENNGKCSECRKRITIAGYGTPESFERARQVMRKERERLSTNRVEAIKFLYSLGIYDEEGNLKEE